MPVPLPRCPLLLFCFLIIALSTSFSINLYKSCISVVFGPVVHLFDISSHSFSRAITNLHEQLSVKLWQYNSRMITEHLDVLSVASVCSGVFQ